MQYFNLFADHTQNKNNYQYTLTGLHHQIKKSINENNVFSAFELIDRAYQKAQEYYEDDEDGCVLEIIALKKLANKAFKLIENKNNWQRYQKPVDPHYFDAAVNCIHTVMDRFLLGRMRTRGF